MSNKTDVVSSESPKNILLIELTEKSIVLWPKEGKPITFEKAPGLIIEGKFKLRSD